MAVRVKVLNLAIVRPLVGHVEGAGYGTPVGVFPALLKEVSVRDLVQVIDGVVECDQNHLWHFFHWYVACIWFQVIDLETILFIPIKRENKN